MAVRVGIWLGDDREKARKRRGGTLNTALEEIGVHHPAAEKHFRDNIDHIHGARPSYSPPSQRAWLLGSPASSDAAHSAE